MKRRFLFAIVAACGFAAGNSARLYAQGVTTGSLTGTVSDDEGHLVEAAQIQLRNPATGYSVGATTRSNGTYLIQGINPDADYVITVRHIGFQPVTRDHVVIALGLTRREDFKLSKQVAVLSTVTISMTTDPVINASKTGTSTTLSDSALHRLPTLNRNFADFVQLVPQVSTTTGYLSGGGVNLRQNAIQIDGAQSGDMFGLGTTGQPGSQANAKSIPLDAVKEYQVLLSPFDVRQGGFGGLLINAVTRSGTNKLHGSVFEYTRNQSLTRTAPVNTNYSQQQFGGSLGGPLLSDKAFFFVSGEFQHLQKPVSGPDITSPGNYIAPASIDQLNSILSSKYAFTGAGTGDKVVYQNPNRNVFARVDATLPWNTRIVVRDNYIGADNLSFGRSLATAASPNFNLTSNKYQFSSKTNSAVAELLTNFTNGWYNELLTNYSTTKDFRTVPVTFPQLTIRGIPRTDNSNTANFVLGTESSSQGNSLDQRTTELTDNLTIPIGSHSITLGTKNLFYRSINLFAANSLGNWTFNDLNSLNNGTPSSYIISAPAPTDPYAGLATIRANTYDLYAQDVWTVTPTFNVSYGVRWDKPSFQNLPPENDAVFTQYGRHTSSVPSEAQWSPRIGFNWDVSGDQRNQLRGGIGSFSGAVPFVYLSNAFGNSGLSGFSSLTCNGTTVAATATTSFLPPAFTAANAATPPTACAPFTRSTGVVVPGATVTGPGSGTAVNTIDPNFKYPKYLKGTLGFDHRIGETVIATIEGLYTRSQDNAFYQNLALNGPQGTDSHGRVLYGTLTATGGTPSTKGQRLQVLDLTNSSGDYTWSVTGQLQKTFSNSFEGSAAYTYQQARDVVSVTSSTAGSNYRYQRDVSGKLDDMSVTRSKYDQPHRIVATGTYRTHWATDLSVIYTGNSGAPFDFVYGPGTGSGGIGDANADGNSQNDLMYVPKNANDQNEILFAGYNGTAAQQATATQQAQAFESFISSNSCLNSQRGTIMKRNSCRNPWVNEFDVSAAQSLGKLGGRAFQNLELRLDIINFGNLLNKNWGRQAFSDQGSTCGQICSATVVLTQTGNKLPTGATSSPLAQGIYTFNTAYTTFSSANISSLYRMQLSMRYSF